MFIVLPFFLPLYCLSEQHGFISDVCTVVFLSLVSVCLLPFSHCFPFLIFIFFLLYPFFLFLISCLSLASFSWKKIGNMWQWWWTGCSCGFSSFSPLWARWPSSPMLASTIPLRTPSSPSEAQGCLIFMNHVAGSYESLDVHVEEDNCNC